MLSPNFKNGSSFSSSSPVTEDMFTALRTVPFLRKSIIWSATATATFVCASRVDAPRCGVATTLSSSKSGVLPGGSVSKTSRAAPATLPDLIASQSASSSTIPPRAQLITITPSFILSKASLLRSPVVCFNLGTCTVI